MSNMILENVVETDIDFLIDQFSLVVHERRFELPSDYTERVRYIDKELTPFPGKFSFDKAPFFREIVDLFSPDSDIKKVVIMKGNQMAATTSLLEPIILYHIGCNPSSQLLVEPDNGMAEKTMKTKIDKMIDGADLRKLIFSQTRKASGSRNTGDTTLSKEYPGGYLHASGAETPKAFRNFSYKIVLVDELDAVKQKLKDEGTVTGLAKSRTDAYPNTGKILFQSTPKTEQGSLIYKEFLTGTQEKFFVPCKHCGEMQELQWTVWDESKNKIGGIVWENDSDFRPIIETVGYQCPHCKGIMKNYDKADIIHRGEWRSTAKPIDAKTRSFHISPLYNTPGLYSWEQFVLEWAVCWDIKSNRIRDKERYREFRNLKQGLPFREMHEQVSYEKAVLHRRHGFVRREVPNKLALQDTGSEVLIVICSVDVQGNGLWVDVKGYSQKGATWTLDFFFIEGTPEDFHGCWDPLEEFLRKTTFDSDTDKAYRIAFTGIDSGRYTDYVYSFCRRGIPGVYAIKGRDFLGGGETYRLMDKTTLDKSYLTHAYLINTTKLKDLIAYSLNFLEWNEGEYQKEWYPNFADDFRDDYFRQFEAEEKVEVINRITNQWQKTIWKAKSGAANHAFDTYVYNLAMLEIFADDCCRRTIGLKFLHWDTFWAYAKRGAFSFQKN